MKKAVLGLNLLILLSFSAGCAPTRQQAFNLAAPGVKISSGQIPSIGKAKIYVLREFALLGAGIAINIKDTGKFIGQIGPRGVLAWERNPGYAVIGASGSNNSNISLAVDADTAYFIEARTDWGSGFNSAAAEIQLLSNDEGEFMLDSIRGQKDQ